MLPSLKHFGGKGLCQSSRMGIRKIDKQISTHIDLHKPNNKLVSAYLEHFGARTNHKQAQIHKTCHDPNLAPKHHFVLGLPTKSPEIPKIGTLATLGAHNFVCRPPIEMRFQAKLQPSSRAFQRYVLWHLHARKLGQFLTFNGRESNWQFDS